MLVVHQWTSVWRGIYFNTENVYLGLSSLHITEPTIEKDDGNVINLSRHYFLLAGYINI